MVERPDLSKIASRQGSVVAQSIERPEGAGKLIAVVYADMVGYSRLIGLDDVGTIDRLRGLRRDVIDPGDRGAWRQGSPDRRRLAADRIRQHRGRGALCGHGTAAGPEA